MIAYNKTWLENLRIQDAVKRDHQDGLINAPELIAINTKYPVGFYTPAIFARIGLFLLTCVIVFFGDGLLSLMFLFGAASPAGFIFFFALLSYGGLELIIHAKKHYRSGVDDALLFVSACQFVIAFAIFLYSQAEDYLTLSLLVFALNLYLTLRFADMLMSALCCIAFFAVIFFGIEKIGAVGLAVIPFVMMAAAGGLYLIVKKLKKSDGAVNYENCLVVAEIVCLLTLYAAGDYFIVQSLSDEINNTVKPIAFGLFFWGWTFILPLLYLIFGTQRKDTILLRTGLLLIAAAAITFRTYYHILPVDIMLILSGLVILAIVYAVTKYLKTPKHGFTAEEPKEGHLMDNLRVESLVIAETFSHAPAPAEDGSKFGGGDFGGGGSSGGF